MYLFYEILIDPVNNFMMITLEKKALQKASVWYLFGYFRYFLYLKLIISTTASAMKGITFSPYL